MIRNWKTFGHNSQDRNNTKQIFLFYQNMNKFKRETKGNIYIRKSKSLQLSTKLKRNSRNETRQRLFATIVRKRNEIQLRTKRKANKARRLATSRSIDTRLPFSLGSWARPRENFIWIHTPADDATRRRWKRVSSFTATEKRILRSSCVREAAWFDS